MPPTEPPLDATMPDIDRFAVHERTAPDNTVDSPGVTLLNRLLGYAPLTEGTMEPDVIDATVEALPHQLDRNLGMRGNDEAVYGAGNGDEVGETPHALDFWSGGVDGKNLITGVAELAEDGVGRLFAASGHAGDGDALPAKEISYGFWKCGHALTLPVLRPSTPRFCGTPDEMQNLGTERR